MIWFPTYLMNFPCTRIYKSNTSKKPNTKMHKFPFWMSLMGLYYWILPQALLQQRGIIMVSLNLSFPKE